MKNYVVLSKDGRELQTDILVHPGIRLKKELVARSLKKKDFAEQLGIHASQLSDLLNGKRHFNAMLALKLERLLGIESDFWLRLQNSYDLNVARMKMPENAENVLESVF